MKKLNHVMVIFTKIAEVCYWVVCGFMIVMTAMVASGHSSMLRIVSDIDATTEHLDSGSFNIWITDMSQVQAVGRAYIIFFITVLIVSALMAMVFRNVHLSLKTAEGRTKFSRGETPFQPDIVRMVREIGIFLIAIPVVEFIMSIIGRIAIGPYAEISTSFNGVMIGLIVLCLAQFFAYGAQLQEDSDGLV